MDQTDLAHHRMDEKLRNAQGTDLSRHTFFNGPVEKRVRGRVANVWGVEDNPTEDTEISGGHIVQDVRTQEAASNDYDGGTVSVARAVDSEVVTLLPNDTRRTRALIVNNGASPILVGKASSGLGQGNGFTIVAGGQMEVLTSARIQGVVVASAALNTVCPVSVWSERNR